ncbi:MULTISPECIES: leucine--tRNA ligase [unclassified Undibacterium]|uniref:leucine--tRNA ligase n=2 Tax=Pseudomonadota TaxID=1224 RepID=UPI002AC9B766|nr:MULTISPECIES: leucine--tRNA ligase [unclassified Undibacterium]MEB0137923.1 leucine--tRNA ligase [Undibacterium sp. CCC2.1]MEB0172043.1 leucine--tRNA ligase [Undibacterium sp. CCC1.1]MEB0174931.1 leucine--tRNA ligase [Undibacterium sp. CCC3.4]MEB0214861.1 leucine--tRNA ligase [Undibacterium sp. 5I2]WPX45376.1 leucine--tRNA ligase [Undibacterium sp. CCC3.4]
MQEKYTPSDVEQSAQAHWKQIDAYTAVENDPRFPKGKYYACSMLPYPSGKLHMGHVRNYTINDMLARQLRMKGYNVLMPMGWDAFGLPAENAAIAYNKSPAEWTYANIADMKSQMQPLGLAFDWSREVATCDPDYYRWNQWLFLKMLEKGIAYKKTQVVNWDPVDQTVLANEQVIDGRGWRSGALVEKREIPGYYFAITEYADELLDSIDSLDGWPEQVRTMQRNWIGKSEGVRFAFTHDIKDAAGSLIQDGKMYVFTTRADTIMGVTFCAVAAEHPLATLAAEDNPALAAFIEVCKAGGTSEAEMATKEKEGMPTGLFVTHPLTGESVAVWVGNYVLMTYGDGAVMGVPAHDERDFAFAKKYQLAIKQVVAVTGHEFSVEAWDEAYGDKQRGVLVNSGPYDGLTCKAAVDAVAADLAARDAGEKKTTWRLRDWGISRQRYWGTPIPIIHCASCGDVPVPYADLPVVLPTDCIPDGSGNPLKTRADFLHVACPTCGQPAERETDTMDTFVDSSWYFMRYTCPDADTMVDARQEYWMAMDQYIGGVEHAVLHLLYARFWTKAMRDLGLVSISEPFKNLFTQGMLLNESYFREDASGKKTWFYPNEIEVQHDDKGRPVAAIKKSDGLPVQMGGIEKMSKSKNNVVEPKDIITQFGADTARLFTMFAGPPDQSAAWSSSGVEGASRYLRRLWATGLKCADTIAAGRVAAAAYAPEVQNLRREVHLTLKQIDADYERLQYNTVVSGAMKLLNAIESFKSDGAGHAAAVRDAFSILLRALYPVCPHIAHVMWQELGFAGTDGELIDAAWPIVDESALIQDEIEMMIQVNGKLRGSIKVAKDADKASIEAAALAHESVQRFLEGPVKKVIVVPGKLINVVA